ncbi:hypothetical protein [Yersinia intermedia]|uniref:Tail fiber protein n=1 Tax=Yersinia intermedia TaxID=631 RepID=A0A0T9LSF3_YERIN|nr:hypothetical protein [Yersinia intermedia]CNF18124.1 Uncharacterised protein [Yersinia intermedia]
MALTLLSANNASTVLSAGISASATTLTVNTGTGGLFPSPVSGTSFFKLTLIDAATGTLTEIVHVTARTGDTMTIVRAQEGTVSRLWSANDIAANMMTAGTLDLLSQKSQSLQIANNLSDLASPQTALTNLGLTGIGIGLSTQPTIANFDFQTFAFTSGANYAVSSSTWLNVPVEVVYPTGIIISITVISVPGSNVILKLVPHVSSAGKYNTYYVRMSGAAGSRTIYVTQDWNSTNPIPITGGGTGAIDAAGGRTNLGLGTAAQRAVGTASANIPDIAIADARYKPIDYTPVLSRVWVSNEYQPVTGTPTIVSHGLTGIDVLHCKADVLLKCIAADLTGYSPGDFAAGWGIHYTNAPLSPIPALSTSTITISAGNAGTGILVSGKGGGPSYAIDTTKWRFIFRIFY